MFDETTIQAIKDTILVHYYQELKTRCRELYSDTIAYYGIHMILDAFGKMTMYRVTLSDGLILDTPIEQPMLQYLKEWKIFPVKKAVGEVWKV